MMMTMIKDDDDDDDDDDDEDEDELNSFSHQASKRGSLIRT